jgi:nucleoside phosphorylase
MIVIVGALQREASGIIRLLGYNADDGPEDFAVYRSRSKQNPVIVLSGSGSKRASRATIWAIEKFSPDAIVSVGFCGATKEHQRSGDLIIATDVINLAGSPFEWSIPLATDAIRPNRSLMLAARSAVEIAGLDYHLGSMVTISALATTSGAKRWLGDVVGGTAFDTKSHAIAIASTERHVPWISVSAVLDDLDVNVPKIIDRVDTGPKQRGLDTYVKHLLHSPKDFPSLRRLKLASDRAKASLTTFMPGFIKACSDLKAIN